MLGSVFTLATFAAAALPVAFGQIVVNGGFEDDGDASSTITGWDNVDVAVDGGWFTYNAADATNLYQTTVDPNGGTYSLTSSSFTEASPDVITQALTGLTPQCYTISFDFSNGGEVSQYAVSTDPTSGPSYDISFSFNGFTMDLTAETLAFQQGSPTAVVWNTYTFVLPASGVAAQDTLSFSSWSANQFPGLDQVTVVADPTATTGTNGLACFPVTPSNPARSRRNNAKRFNHGGVQW